MAVRMQRVKGEATTAATAHLTGAPKGTPLKKAASGPNLYGQQPWQRALRGPMLGRMLEPGGKLPTHMTAREITEHYQPLDADRGYMPGRRGYWAGTQESDRQLWRRKYEEAEDPYSYRGAMTRKYQTAGGRITGEQGHWSRTMRSDYDPNRPRTQGTWTQEYGSTRKASPAPEIPGQGKFTGMPATVSPPTPTPRSSAFRSTFREHQTVSGGDEPGPLSEHIAEHGMPGQISLGSLPNYGRVKRGSMGKPEIVGGHHRLAVMRKHHPDVLLPVAHFQDIQHARGVGNYS